MSRKETKFRSATLSGKVASTYWYVPVGNNGVAFQAGQGGPSTESKELFEVRLHTDRRNSSANLHWAR
jgi:hypothetical protein